MAPSTSSRSRLGCHHCHLLKVSHRLIQVLPTYDVWGLSVLSMTMLLRGHAWCAARAEDVDFQRFYTVVLQVRELETG